MTGSRFTGMQRILAALAETETEQDASIVGTWRLLSYEDWDKSGRRTVPFGEHPRGYIVFDPTGHVTIQIMRMPALSPLASGDEEVATPGEKQAAYDAYAAYFGTYTVAMANSSLTSKEACVPPTPIQISRDHSHSPATD